MPTHILVNNLGLTYKSTIGLSTATLPDVCKTPSPGGPVPIPYPNIADQGSLKKGTKTVKAMGKMIAIKGSEYSTSTGDEPGTAGGVKSSTFKKETSWITYSFDVKMDGKNACRHTDKKFHNHKNTVDLAGNLDPAAAAAVKVLNEIAKECNEEYNKIEAQKIKNKKKRATCQKLGQDKHKCCDNKIKEHQKNPPPKGDPALEGEQAYNRPKFKKGKAVQPVDKTLVAINRGRAISDAIKSCGKGASRKAIGKAIGKALAGLVFPDAAIVGPPKILVDFKFACPETHRSKKRSTKKNYRPPSQSKKQKMAHNALGDADTITILF